MGVNARSGTPPQGVFACRWPAGPGQPSANRVAKGRGKREECLNRDDRAECTDRFVVATACRIAGGFRPYSRTGQLAKHQMAPRRVIVTRQAAQAADGRRGAEPRPQVFNGHGQNRDADDRHDDHFEVVVDPGNLGKA